MSFPYEFPRQAKAMFFPGPLEISSKSHKPRWMMVTILHGWTIHKPDVNHDVNLND